MTDIEGYSWIEGKYQKTPKTLKAELEAAQEKINHLRELVKEWEKGTGILSSFSAMQVVALTVFSQEEIKAKALEK